ncbi:MAG: hypothetical protein ACO3N7_10645 [Kiritimatiellia bacterium]
MTDSLPPPISPPSETPKSGRNCWVVGCSGCLIVLAVIVLLGMLISWQIKRTFLVEPFEPVQLSPQEEKAAQLKLESLNLLEEGGKSPEKLEIPQQGLLLTEDEMNYWISTQDNELADSVRLDFEPGELTAEVRMGEPGGKRWNLKARLSVVHEDNLLDVRLLDLKLGRFSLPASLMDEFAKENLATETFEDPETRAAFESRVERIEILKDQILFIPRREGAEAP